MWVMDESDERFDEELCDEGERRGLIEGMVDKAVRERRAWLAEQGRCNEADSDEGATLGRRGLTEWFRVVRYFGTARCSSRSRAHCKYIARRNNKGGDVRLWHGNQDEGQQQWIDTDGELDRREKKKKQAADTVVDTTIASSTTTSTSVEERRAAMKGFRLSLHNCDTHCNKAKTKTL